MHRPALLRPTPIAPSRAASEAEGPVSPWARLNLRHNPFGEPTPEELADLLVVDGEDELTAWLGRGGRAVQFLGDEGRGKTAHLLALRCRFPGAAYRYLPEEGRLPLLPAAEAGPLLLDEAQRLPRRRRRRLFSAFARCRFPLALASHTDLAAELECCGLEVRTRRVAGLDPDRLLAVVERRLEGARRRSGPLPRLDRPDAERLIDRFDDDLRSILDHLYEVYQRRLETEERPCPSVS